MYNRTKKIPTIIALLILIIGIGGGIYLVENRTKIDPQAQTSNEPLLMKITNLNDTFFSIIWLTKEKVTGSVISGESIKEVNQIAFDDRDSDNQAKPYQTHSITLRNLKPKTTYYFKILSGGKTFQAQDQPYTVVTAPKINNTNQLEPAYGQILTAQNTPSEGTLVILTLPDALPLSTLTKPSGNWLIALNTARDMNMDSFKTNGIVNETVIVYSSFDEQAQATTDTNNDSPVPPITLGKTYNFEGLLSKKNETQQLALEQTTDKTQQVLGKQNEKITIYSPEEGTTFVSDRPLIRGKGIPNKEILIEIESTQKITGKTKVNSDGTWTWTPPKGLSPDKHKLTITTTDESGQKIVLERNFLVFKSGTQVLGVATPSGTLTTTPSPTINLTPTVTGGASPSATLKPLFSPTPPITKIPVSGNTTTTIAILGAGFVIFLIGFAKLFFSM